MPFPVHPAARWTAAAVIVLALTAGTTACSGSSSASDSPSTGAGTTASADATAGLGDWPTFLPSPSAGSVATGSAESPAMSYPGSPVVAEVRDGTVRVDVDGPTYPSSTKTGAEQVECTFTITLSKASRTVSLSGARFDVLDSQGGIHSLKAVKGAEIPSSLAPGKTATVKVTGVLPAGEGLLRFYPVAKKDAVAAWDYVAETD